MDWDIETNWNQFAFGIGISLAEYENPNGRQEIWQFAITFLFWNLAIIW